MRVIHVSNFGEKHDGRLFWNHCFKISNGFIRNGHSVYNFSDRDISRSSLLSKFNSNAYVGLKLIRLCKNFNPDLIVLGHADRISIETLENIKSINKDVKIIEWNIDNYFLDNTEQKLKNRSHAVDGFFTHNADENLRSCLNRNFIAFFPNIFDLSIERLKIFNLSDHSYDIFSAISHGVGTGKLRRKKSLAENKNERVETLNSIINKCVGTKCDFYGLNYVQPIWASQFESIIKKSYMGLCVQRKPFLKYGVSDRFAQYQGNGMMTFLPKQTQLKDLFQDRKDVVYFNDNDELHELINYYTKNKDEALNIAQSGWQKGHKLYNEKIITQYFIDLVFNKKGNPTWPENVFYE